MTPTEVLQSEMDRLTRMVANDQSPPGREAALWHLLGQFKDASNKILAAAEAAIDNSSEDLAAELEGAVAQNMQLRHHLGWKDLSDEEVVAELGYPEHKS